MYLGSGLGLYLCKNLCNLMDGDISVNSIYGQGSKFTFWISTKVAVNQTSTVIENLDEGNTILEIVHYFA